MTVRSFSTAQKEQEAAAFEGVDPITFDVDGEEFTAYPPTGSQLALALAAQSEHSKPTERMRGLIDFLDGILDDNAQARFRERLLDRDDPFDFQTVEQIILWLVEEWSARPTQPSSGSPRSRRGTGRRLTATPPSVVPTS